MQSCRKKLRNLKRNSDERLPLVFLSWPLSWSFKNEKKCMKKLFVIFMLMNVAGFSKDRGDTLHYDKRCVLKFGIAAGYQNNKFVNTDFTGVNTFIYENKIRYSANANVEIDLSEKYFLIAGIRMQDVGWKRLDTVSYVETHRDHSKYSFL